MSFARLDNGPEFIARAVTDWCRFNDVGSVFIDLGSPGQNAWIESFNGRCVPVDPTHWHLYGYGVYATNNGGKPWTAPATAST